MGKSKYPGKPRTVKKHGQTHIPKNTDRKARRYTESLKKSKKRKYPLQHYVILYSIFGFIILSVILLVIFTIWRYSQPVKHKKSGPTEIWMDAEHYHTKAVYYYEDISKHSKDHKYYKALKKIDSLYQKALNLGWKAWNTQIEWLMKKNHWSKEQTQAYARKNYAQIKTLKAWERERQEIRQELKNH